MLQHRDAVGGGKCNSAARPTFANNHRDHRHADLQAHLGRACDRLGLATLFGTLAGIGPGGVHQRDHRQAEPSRHLHQAHRLAVAFGARHAKVMGDARFGVRALLVPNHHHRLVVKARKPPHHRKVIGKVAIPRERRVLAKELFDIVLAVRTLRVACHLTFAPCGQIRIEIFQKLRGFLVQRGGFVIHIHFFVGARHRPQLFRLAFDFGEGFFEFKILGHAVSTVTVCPLYGLLPRPMQLSVSDKAHHGV